MPKVSPEKVTPMVLGVVLCAVNPALKLPTHRPPSETQMLVCIGGVSAGQLPPPSPEPLDPLQAASVRMTAMRLRLEMLRCRRCMVLLLLSALAGGKGNRIRSGI